MNKSSILKGLYPIFNKFNNVNCFKRFQYSSVEPLGSIDKIEKEQLYQTIQNCIQRFRFFEEIDLKPAELEWNYILNEENLEDIEENIKNRSSNCDIRELHQCKNNLLATQRKFNESLRRLNSGSFLDDESFSRINNLEDIDLTFETSGEIESLVENLYNLGLKLPNKTHPIVPIQAYPIVISEYGKKIEKKQLSIDQISKLYGWLSDQRISLYSTQRSYILKKELADLESALIRYTLSFLKKRKFILISTPDILHHSIIESCGFPTTGKRNQVYKLDYKNEYGKYCLSGTAEMGIAGLLKNQVFNEKDLPLKLCAVSRCYRAEVSGSEKEGKLYRLHEFNKAEMFVITRGCYTESQNMLDELRNIQIELFSDLGLHFR
jgi:seryl-tRNA synthetase